MRDLAALGTAWTPQLAGPVTVSPPIPGLTVRYSTEINPCRPSLAPTNPGCTPMTDGIAPGPGVWSLSLPSDPTAVRSLKLTFGSYVLLANQTVRLTFPLFAPADAPIAGPGPNGTFGDADDTNVAWNSFAYEAVRVDDGTRLVAQPSPVGVAILPTPGGLASYGDYVWNDGNQNGSQDEPPYRGVNGATVRLYSDADGNPATTGDQTLIGTQITHADESGNPGFYRFPALSPGFYFAEVVPPAGFQISPKDTTADTIDSDLSTVTGRTDITQLTAGENDLTWDAGVYAPVVSMGNRVWFDTNNDRLDNDGAGGVPGSSTGIPGVRVQLFKDANGDGAITGGEQSWLAQQTTDASGFYLFTAQTHEGGVALGSPVPLYPGGYLIGVAPANMQPGGPLAGYHSSGTTISTAGVISELAAPSPDSNADRDDNGSTIRAPAVFYSGGVLSGPLFVDASEPTGEPEGAGNAPGPLPIADNTSNLTVDFGFYTVGLGNLVWADDGAGGGTRANGLRDGGEAGLAGVTVRLFSQDNTAELPVGPDGLLGTADDAAGGMVTGAGGAYRFGNLPQGQYRVRMTAPTGYVSTRDTAGTSSPSGNIDNDDNGPGVNAGTTTSSAATLTPGAAGTLNNNTVTAAAGSTLDPTLDFGIVRSYSLGNRVWNDRNNSGARDLGEPGISGVVVRLYLSDGVTVARRIDGSNVPDSTTNATGYYRFDNLPAGDYLVEVIGSNFTGASPLVGFRSSTGAAGAYEPSPDPDNDSDNDDNGTAIGGAARSQVITLGEGSGTAEPTSAIDGDGGVVSSPEAQDNQSNRTVDFGFYASMSLGNRVWEDADNNGTLNGAEAGISGVPVSLYRDNDNNSVPDSAAIATTTTNAGGYFLFTGLITETYIVEIVPPAGYQSSTGNFGAYEPAPDADTVVTDNDDNGSAGAGVIRSAPITLAAGVEPTGEPATPGLSDDARDTNANYTVDFGLFRPLSLGNLVWLDADDSGTVSGGEAGIAGVTVRLYRDSDANGAPDDLAAPAGVTPADAIRAMTTNAGGHYLFTGLGAGAYIVEAVTPAGLVSSTGRAVPAPYEPAPDPDTDIDIDDNGTVNAAVVRSAPVTLSVGAEPTGEPATPGLSDTTPDDSSNTTVDFGFYTGLSLGNLVWDDADNSGSVSGAESGLAGVSMRLYRDDNDDGAPDDIDGAPGISAGDATAATTTGAGGHYLFTGLNAGTYIVEVAPPPGYRSSTGALDAYEPAPDADASQSDDDDNGSAAGAAVRSAPVTLTVGGEPAGEPATPGLPDATADTNSNTTLDFGLYEAYSLGSRVWEDRNNDGLDNDGADAGLGAVSVSLYRDSDSSGALSAADSLVATATTAADGSYLFTELAPGSYLVQLPGANFAGAGPLQGLTSSTGAPGSPAGPYEPAPAANGDLDADDNGSVGGAGLTAAGWGGGVAGGPVTLGPGASEPTGEPAMPGVTDPSSDDRSNRTLDFGLYDPSLIEVSVEQAADQADPTNSAPISFRVVFSRPIVSASFAPADLTIGGSAPGALAGTIAEIAPNDGTTFAVALGGMSGSGTAQLSLGADVVVDRAGNPNLASTSDDNTVTYDVTAPSVSITPESAATSSVPVRFLLSFSEPISGLSSGGLTLGGTAGATSLSITEIAPNDGTTFVAAASGMTSAGTVVVGVPAGAAADRAGNPSQAAPADAVAQFTAATPAVTGIVALDPSPTNAASARFRLSFSEPVTGLDLGDLQLSLSGGVTGAALEPAALADGQVFTLTVQLGAGDGGVRLDLIDDGTITSAATRIGLGGAGPGNGTFTGGDVYQIDRTAPRIAIAAAPGQADPAGALPVVFTLTADEPVDGLTAADLLLGGTSGAADLTLAGGGTSYTATVGRVARGGTITLALPAGAAQDAVGNPSAAAAAVIRFADSAAPQATLAAPLADRPADGSAAPYQILVRYSDDLALDAATLGDDDLAVAGPGGALTATLVSVDTPGDGATRVATYAVAAPGGAWDSADGGSYSVAVAAGAVRDSSGNGVLATPLGSFRVPAGFRVALPMLAAPAAPAALPDLIVERVEGAGSQLRVRIRNVGAAPTSAPFWVDAYIAPATPPRAVNQTWQLLGARGATWGVIAVLAPGESLTLTVGGQFFNDGLSDLGGPLAPGTRLYAQVDSANAGTTYGGVLEQHESAGGAYNNIGEGIAGSEPLAQAGAALEAPASPGKAPLPRR